MEVRSLGIIMDGNRRWANAHGLKPWEGHKAGVEVFIESIKWLAETDVQDVAYYAFSSENWKRDPKEVSALLELCQDLVTKRKEELLEQNVRVRFIGNLKKLPRSLRTSIRQIEKESRHNTRTVWICMSYGGRDEIRHASRRVIPFFTRKFDKYLWSRDLPDIDVVIRTGGNKRLSNFLLWKVAYAELLFIDTLWPDLTKDELLSLVNSQKTVEKNLGA